MSAWTDFKEWLWPSMPPPAPAMTRSQREDMQATQRWREHNRLARQAGCMCGRPATEVRYDHRNRGGVPVEFWSCDEHVGVNSWVKLNNGPGYIPANDERTEFWHD